MNIPIVFCNYTSFLLSVHIDHVQCFYFYFILANVQCLKQ
jgi:hypothetical protein